MLIIEAAYPEFHVADESRSFSHRSSVQRSWTIGPRLRRLDDYLAGSSFSYEIVVVLDGPTDNTREILQEIPEKICNLKTIDRAISG